MKNLIQKQIAAFAIKPSMLNGIRIYCFLPERDGIRNVRKAVFLSEPPGKCLASGYSSYCVHYPLYFENVCQAVGDFMNTAELAKKLSIKQRTNENDKEFKIRLEYWYEKWKSQNYLEDD